MSTYIVTAAVTGMVEASTPHEAVRKMRDLLDPSLYRDGYGLTIEGDDRFGAFIREGEVQ